eukprot:3613455-Amphidinium_carterae.1
MPDGTWAPSAQAAMDDAAEVLGQPVATALGASAVTIVLQGTVKATTKLRRLYYERIGATLCAQLPDHAPPPAATLGTPARATPFQQQLALAWYTAPTKDFLPAEVLRLGVKMRLGADLIAAHLPCKYVTQAGTRCAHTLDRHGSHVFSCAHGPSIHRHNSVRDVWLKQMRLAGWHAVPEQDVLTRSQRAGPAMHRADLTAVNAAGLRLAFDVSLTGLANQLVAVETAKLHVYGVNQAAMCVASGERFYPLGMHARTGHFGPSAVEVLNLMAKDSAPRLAQETGQALGLVKAQHAMRSAAQLNAQALTGTLRMIHSCVSCNLRASPPDSQPPLSQVPAGPVATSQSSPGPGRRALPLSGPEALG